MIRYFVVILTCLTFPSVSIAEEIDASVLFANQSSTPNFRVSTNLQLNGLILGSSSQFSTSAPFEAIEVPGAFADIGRGYNLFSNRMTPESCVKLVGKSDKAVYPKVLINKSLDFATSIHTFSSASASSVSFGVVIKKVSLGFASNSTSASSYNRVDKFGRIYERIVTSSIEWPKVEWASPSYAQLAENDMKTFLDKCGSRYIRGVYAGTSYEQVVRYSLDEDTESNDNSAALSVGVKKIFSGSAAFASAVTDMNKIAVSNAQTFGKGSLSTPPAPTAGQDPTSALLAYYYGGLEAATKIDKDSSAVPLYIVVDKYYTSDNKLPFGNRVPSWNEVISQAVLDRNDDYDSVLGSLSEINYALEDGHDKRIGMFYMETADAAGKKRKDAIAMIKAFQNAITRCQNDASGPEYLADHKSAVEDCQKELDDALPADKVASLQLTRRYHP